MPVCGEALADVYLSADAPPNSFYTLSLHDALPICPSNLVSLALHSLNLAGSSERLDRTEAILFFTRASSFSSRSEEHTSELQSRREIVCRLLLEKKNYGGIGADVSRSPLLPMISSA